MIKRSTTLLLSLLSTLLATAIPVRGAVVYRYETDQTSYTVVPGGTTAVQVYLTESLGLGDSSSIAAGSGLFSVAASITRSGAVPGTPSFPSGVIANVLLDGTVLASTLATRADVYGDRLSAVGPGLMPSANGRILVGTFNITGGGSGEVTQFTVGDYQAGSDDVLLYDFTVLDAVIQPTQFAVTVVPEPAVATVLSAAGALMCRRRKA